MATDPSRQKSIRKILWSPVVRVGGFVITISILGIAAFYLTLRLFLGNVETVTLPDVVGKDITAALEEFAAINMSVRVEAVEFSSRYEKGRVFEQRPEGGRVVKKSRVVRLMVSKGLQALLMPDLIGKPVRLAEQTLSNSQMESVTTLSACSPFAKDSVIAQNPEPRAAVARKAEVELVVSSGGCDRYFVLPDYRNMFVEDVAKKLAAANMTYVATNAKQTHAKTDEQGRILEQRPQAGAIVSSSELIHFDVVGVIDALRTKLHYRFLRLRTPYGFSRRKLSIRIFNESLTPIEIDKWVAPGQNIELVVPNAENLDPELYLDDVPVESYRFGGSL